MLDSFQVKPTEAVVSYQIMNSSVTEVICLFPTSYVVEQTPLQESLQELRQTSDTSNICLEE